jgi:hypothetical protein
LISDFRRYVDEICALLGYYAALSGNCLPTFRDKITVTTLGRVISQKSADLKHGSWVNLKQPSARIGSHVSLMKIYAVLTGKHGGERLFEGVCFEQSRSLDSEDGSNCLH